MPIVTVCMDEHLVRRLEELAKLRRITREEALEHHGGNPVREALHVLRQLRVATLDQV